MSIGEINMIEQYKEEIYQEVKKEKQDIFKRQSLKEFGAIIISFYVMFSSLILGQLFAFLYMFVLSDMLNTMTYSFGRYTVIISYGLLSTSFTALLFFISVVGLSLYHISQSLIDKDIENKKE